MRYSMLAACLFVLTLASTGSAGSVNRPARITPEMAAQIRALKAQTADLRAAIRADLKAIQSGGYVSKEEIRQLGQAVAAAVSDGTLTPQEKAALSAQASALAAQIPAELRDKLQSDLQALGDMLESQ